MDTGKLLRRLNWFYSLELNQVDLYMAQSQRQEDVYLANTLRRIAGIEQQHVDNIAQHIKNLGGQPTLLGDVIAPLLGKITGTATALTGTRNVLFVNITLEEKAMQDYKDLLIKIEPHKKLHTTLWDNLIDEDLHTAWMANKLQELDELAKT